MFPWFEVTQKCVRCDKLPTPQISVGLKLLYRVA